MVNLHAARALLLSGQAQTVGVINCERYTTRVDYSDRASCVLFGDSASAAILEASDTAHGLELIDTVVHSDPAGYEHVRLPDGGYFSQNGQAVQKFAVNLAKARQGTGDLAGITRDYGISLVYAQGRVRGTDPQLRDSWVLMGALIFFGALSLTKLGISQMPDVNFPILNVTINGNIQHLSLLLLLKTGIEVRKLN